MQYKNKVWEDAYELIAAITNLENFGLKKVKRASPVAKYCCIISNIDFGNKTSVI